jgi:DNA-directed RNA polymerase I subunit RPA2
VLSYTGYDMEDAMILNKSSYERGFAHASVYKTIEIDLKDEIKAAGASSASDEVKMRFGNKLKRGRRDEFVHVNLDEDGLPRVGDKVTEGDALYCIVDTANDFEKAGKHKEREYAYIQTVRAVGGDSGKAVENKLSLTLRFNRNPVIGDKFSSRHGQKVRPVLLVESMKAKIEPNFLSRVLLLCAGCSGDHVSQ